MKNTNSQIVTSTLKALLDGRTLNRKDFNNGSLHSWVSTIRNQRFVPVESSGKNSDGTCDYYMLSEEIERYKDVVGRKKQRAEMKLTVETERQKKLIEQVLKFFERLIMYPSLWGLWDELPFRLDDIAKQINALLGQEKSVNQNNQ